MIEDKLVFKPTGRIIFWQCLSKWCSVQVNPYLSKVLCSKVFVVVVLRLLFHADLCLWIDWNPEGIDCWVCSLCWHKGFGSADMIQYFYLQVGLQLLLYSDISLDFQKIRLSCPWIQTWEGESINWLINQSIAVSQIAYFSWYISTLKCSTLCFLYANLYMVVSQIMYCHFVLIRSDFFFYYFSYRQTANRQ